ncbi:hypothetical protein BU25DRAFT_468748 [Macroventuria anomochaeta]|uniref:Uncharacterized protein n=1 Tax=Macroventuria anomochaeta TaxID=301207 RepID=A0ACB6S2S4_9PLEO|nr:uncharacterized protein BU25DRAFT_468748 [Macroventuria anomochaeta]KAF2627698.1 hypothetical protein BU25DRAFT_468748 [Macroventuria anomochaeta]
MATLPDWTLNAEQVLCHGMPALNIGEPCTQTVLKAPAIRKHFTGMVSQWNSFEGDVLKEWNHERTKAELRACKGVPVAMNPAIRTLNENVVTPERIQCGGECTLSGRFYANALALVIHAVQTMATHSYGSGDNSYLPTQLTFGDAWIRDIFIRDNRLQPNVVGKAPDQWYG